MNKLYDENNVFAKILRSEIPCKKILENKFTKIHTSIFMILQKKLLRTKKNISGN